MTEVEVAVKKTPSVQQIYGRKSTRSKSPKKSRARSPYKRDASPKRPWIPAPGRSSLRDSRGDLKWDESGMGDGPQNKTKKAPSAKQATGQKVQSTASETQIFELLDQVIQLKEKLGEKTTLLAKEQELNKTLSEEIVNLAVSNKADATGVEIPAVEDDVYTEVQSDVHQREEIPPIREVVELEPRVTEMYSTFPRESSSSLERTSLQKLLVQAELDLKTLDFTNPAAVDRFMLLSRDIRVKMNVLKEANFDVQRLEEQRDAVVERLVKTDSETAIIKSELKYKDQDLAGLRVDTEIEREKAERLQAKVEHMEQVKAKIQRELFSREGDLNRAQARERSIKKQLLETQTLLDAERATNGKVRLDQEKQALKRACRHHKTKAEMLQLKNDELNIDLKRSQHELSAWKERSIRNTVDAEESSLNHKRNERGKNKSKSNEKKPVKRVSFSDLEFKTEKISALTTDNEIKEETIAKQAREISTMKITIAEMKSQIQDMNYRKARELDLAREDAMGSMAALKDLPEELRIAHRRLDESLGEIRALEEANSDLKFQLDRSQKQLILTEQNESEMKIYHNKLSAAEIRLDEVQKALEETTEELDIARSETQQWRVRADERQQSINALERQIEAANAESRRTLIAEREKYEIKERSLQTKYSDMELELTRQKGELRAVKSQRDELESRSEHVMSDLRERLDHSEATNRSMQSYVNFLKTSYTSTFGDALDE